MNDDTPIGPAWIESQGADGRGRLIEQARSGKKPRTLWVSLMIATYEDEDGDAVYVPWPATRGEYRRLAAALGFKLAGQE